MSTNTVEFHRILKSTADRVYRAFVTPAAVAKWLPPHGFTCTVHEQDARVGKCGNRQSVPGRDNFVVRARLHSGGPRLQELVADTAPALVVVRVVR